MTMNREYPHTADIERVLGNCPKMISNRGLNYLIPRWKMIAGNFLYNDQCTVEEYLAEMTIRFWIGQVLGILGEPERSMIKDEIGLYDDELIARTFELKDCLWGWQIELERGYKRSENFYYYRAPQFVIDQSEEIQKR